MMRTAKIVTMLGLLALCGQLPAAEYSEPIQGMISHWKLDEGSETIAYDYVAENHGTIYGAEWLTGQVGGALSFDGKGDYVQTTLNIDQSGPTDITMAAWVYPTSTSWGRHQVISSDNGGFDWSLLREGRKWHAFVGNTSWKSGFVVDINKWQYVAVVFRVGEDVIFYKNAVSSSRGAAPTTDSRDNDIAIGDNPGWWGEYFNGIISDVMIFDRGLSSEEIQQLYQNGLLERGFPADLEIIGIDNIELAISGKVKALEIIDVALEKQHAAYNTLGRMLEKGEYADLTYDDIVTARQELLSATEHDEQSKKDLEQSIERLENAFTALGFELVESDSGR